MVIKMNKKLIRIIALTIVLSIIFASAGCTNKNTDKAVSGNEYGNATHPVKTDIGDKTTTEDDLNIDTVNIDQMQTDMGDEELDDIERELDNIDW